MDSVFEKTRELGEALLNSPLYAEVKRAEARAEANAEASELMGALMEKRRTLQAQMMEPSPDPMLMRALSEEMDALTEKLEMIDEVAELSQARDAFNNLIGQVNQLLQFIVAGSIEEPGCGGDCRACSGCH